jgi:ATP-dependent DNA ligase
VVAKRLTSTYQPGRRSRSWIKTPIRHTTEVVVAGWYPATGNRNVLGSLLLAGHIDDGVLVYAGDVGTGFTATPRRPAAAAAPPGTCSAAVPGGGHADPRLAGPAGGPRVGPLG